MNPDDPAVDDSAVDDPAVEDPAVCVRGLVVRYGDVEAVGGIDLDVRTGEILAFLGPNGAGKTSTIEVLEGYVKRAAGTVSVLGADPARAGRHWRERIGIVLQASSPDSDLTAVEALRQFACCFADPRPAGELLEQVGLAKVGNRRTTKLSGGELRRLDVAMALVGRPELVFMDEPTTGFDPQARLDAWEMIDGLRTLGVTVLLTTHYMDEAQHLADRIAVIVDGRIVGRGTAQELTEQTALPTRISWDAGAAPAGETAGLPTGPPTGEIAGQAVALVGPSDRRRFELFTHDPAPVLRELLGAPDGDLVAASIAVEPPDLEQCYLALTGLAR